MPNIAIRQQIEEALDGVPVCRALEIRLEHLADGECSVCVPHPEAFNGIIGSYHGGLLATVADCVACFAIWTRTGTTEPLTTCDLSIHYLRPCFGEVAATARVIKFGQTLVPVQVELFDSERTLVAVAQVTYFRLNRQD